MRMSLHHSVRARRQLFATETYFELSNKRFPIRYSSEGKSENGESSVCSAKLLQSRESDTCRRCHTALHLKRLAPHANNSQI